MADWKLTDLDLDLTNGDVTMITGAEAVGQDVLTRLYTTLGESVYGRNLGVPWFDVVFTKGADQNLATIENVLRNIIQQTPGVIGIKEFFFTNYDPIERRLSISMIIDTINGEIDFSTFSPIEIDLGGL